MQSAISNTPFLCIRVEGLDFFIEAYDLATTLILPILITKEADGITDGDFTQTQVLAAGCQASFQCRLAIRCKIGA